MLADHPQTLPLPTHTIVIGLAQYVDVVDTDHAQLLCPSKQIDLELLIESQRLV